MHTHTHQSLRKQAEGEDGGTLLSQIPGLNGFKLFKNPGNATHPLGVAFDTWKQRQLHEDGLHDVRNAFLTSLGVGGGAAGLAGLAGQAKRNINKPRVTSGPALLPLPYPVEPEETPEAVSRRRKHAMDNQLKKDLLSASVLGLAGGGVGAGMGALSAPAGHKREGAARGLAVGAPAGLGAFAYGKGIQGFVQDGGASPSTLAYLTAGSAGALPSALMGAPSWDIDRRNLRDALKGVVRRDALKPPTREEKVALDKTALQGATSKAGLPWYVPAMAAAVGGGGFVGYKGVNSLLKRRAKEDREDELTAARQEFRDALLSQYKRPLAGVPKMTRMPKLASSADAAPSEVGPDEVDSEDCPACGAVMEKGDDGNCNRCGRAWTKESSDTSLGLALDVLYDRFTKVAELLEKRAASKADWLGGAMGAYGLYAGVSGLATGSIAYDQMKKRSRRAVLDKAIKRRDRRRFMQSPTEIYAVPEPISPGKTSLKQELAALKTTPEDSALGSVEV